MSNFHHHKSGTSAFMTLVMGAAVISPLFSLAPVSAQLFPSQRQTFPSQRQSVTNFNQIVIPAGIQIPVEYKESEKILVTKEETIPLTLTVAANIINRNGVELIPFGSEIVGEIQPFDQGSRFVAQKLIINEDAQTSHSSSSQIITSIEGTSQVVTRTEVIRKGASTGEILEGAAIGAAAATVLSAILGDNAIATEEVLGGAGLGALGGWLLGRDKVEVISINPNSDLDVTLHSDIVMR